MKKLLPLLCLSLLPLGASALLENATVSATVLPSADDEWLAIRASDTEELSALVEAQLEKIPGLSGIYVGIIQIRDAATEGDPLAVELLRIVRLDEGENQLELVDEQGAFTIAMALRPEGAYWDVKGKADYFKHGAKAGISIYLSSAVPANLLVFPAGSKAQAD